MFNKFNFEDATDKLLTKIEGGRLIDAFENEDADYIAVSNTLGIKHSTSRSIVANYLLFTGRCGELAKWGYEKRQGR